ncbi:MAG: hypothetical protein EAZ53_16700 [Bacteroidetes bacterium]|nr:MAG: hypothetical protein EAZ53_16700 [Bacteroidota bacterium]
MKTLHHNWLTEGLIDFEYKKYILLSYLQDVKNYFDEHKIYPTLSDLVFHYQNIVSLKEGKKTLQNAFPERVSAIDFEHTKISFQTLVKDDALMEELEEIMDYSLVEIKNHLAEGKNLYELFESKMEISPVGISPLYPDCGYLLISQTQSKEVRIFEYNITIFENANEKYRGVNTSFIESQRKGISNTLENIKIDLIRKYKHLPNPATYVVHANIACPFQESLLPIAKRLLVKYVSTTK